MKYGLQGTDALVPDKCAHCDECDVCVMGLDHHCVFFDACIAKNNFRLFISVICGFFVILIITVVFTAVAAPGDIEMT